MKRPDFAVTAGAAAPLARLLSLTFSGPHFTVRLAF